jgi:DHA1 family multidrug resistance protein-like MFS transporter
MNKKAFAVLVGSMFVSMLGMGIVTPFLPIYANTMGASSTQVGLIQAAFNITGIGTLLFIGRLSDRFGRKPFLSCGLTIMAIAAMGLRYSNDPVHLIFWTLLITYLSVTAGQAIGMPAANAYVVQEGRTFGMGASMTMFMLAMHMGNGVGPVALGSIADWLGLNAVFYAAAICMGTGLTLFAIMVRGALADALSTDSPAAIHSVERVGEE